MNEMAEKQKKEDTITGSYINKDTTEYKYLGKINSPADLKALPEDSMAELCDELRRYLVNIVENNGGHLASNLGVVEMTVAIHRIFDCPKDHIIFDVGHQCYVHKILTGRYDRFDTLRCGGGISGFTKRSESEYDCFGAGHSSTSLSAALGFAAADALSGSDAYTIAIVGDGAFTGGMIHEALNNINGKMKLIVIINENEMSISKNIGRFASNLSRLRRKSGYVKAKKMTATVLRKIPLVGNAIFRITRGCKKLIKNALYGSIYFEDLGLYYLGPADGNNYADVASLLREAKKADESVIIHLKTRKGNGYEPAQNNPDVYHGLPPRNAKPKTGETYSSACGRTLCELAEQDKKICAITAAMSYGTGLDAFALKYKDRFFDVGIAEEHAVTFAAGLAANGYKPVFAVYSTFLQRGYDQLIHDVALQNLPVLFCIDRAGLNAGDGATHHGIFDVAFLSEIPGFKIYTPACIKGLEASIKKAIENHEVAAVRYPSGCENNSITEKFYPSGYDGNITVRSDFKDHREYVYITHGRISAECIKAEEMLDSAGIILCEYIRPYDKLAEEVGEYIKKALPRKVIFVEEEIKAGGFGMMLYDKLNSKGLLEGIDWSIAAVDDDFVIQSKKEDILKTAHLSADYLREIAKR